MSSDEVRQPATPSQRCLTWYVGRESSAAEFRTAAEAWSTAYVRGDHVTVDCSNWDRHKPDAGEVDVLFVCLPLPTMARARAIKQKGPGLLRTREWPWGLPDVEGSARTALEADNDLIRMSMSAIREVAARSSQPTILWVAPEDRGGESGSIWQLRELRQYAVEGGWMRYSFNQCETTSSTSPRPTSVLSLSPLKHTLLRKGWPKLQNDGKFYSGPLEPSCKCGLTHDAWSNQARMPSRELEPGVINWLLTVAIDSGLARHLRTGRTSTLARQPARSRRPSRSVSSSSSSSRSPSRNSAITCIPSPASVDLEDAPAQWDDDAAIALGISTRNRDRCFHTRSGGSVKVSVRLERARGKRNETHRLRVSVGALWDIMRCLHAKVRLMRCSQREYANGPLCAAQRVCHVCAARGAASMPSLCAACTRAGMPSSVCAARGAAGMPLMRCPLNGGYANIMRCPRCCGYANLMRCPRSGGYASVGRPRSCGGPTRMRCPRSCGYAKSMRCPRCGGYARMGARGAAGRPFVCAECRPAVRRGIGHSYAHGEPRRCGTHLLPFLLAGIRAWGPLLR